MFFNKRSLLKNHQKPQFNASSSLVNDDEVIVEAMPMKTQRFNSSDLIEVDQTDLNTIELNKLES